MRSMARAFYRSVERSEQRLSDRLLLPLAHRGNIETPGRRDCSKDVAGRQDRRVDLQLLRDAIAHGLQPVHTRLELLVALPSARFAFSRQIALVECESVAHNANNFAAVT